MNTLTSPFMDEIMHDYNMYIYPYTGTFKVNKSASNSGALKRFGCPL